MQHILVLGGGFAGVEAAIKLKEKGYHVTLVSDRDYLFIYPISIWVPVKGVSFDDCKLSLAKLQQKHGFDLIIDKVEKIDVVKRSIKLTNHELTYDYLFISLGMNKIKYKGAENTLSICGSPEQSVAIGEELDNLITKGEGKIAVGFSGNPKDSTGSVVRGGPAFELLFNISTYLKKKGVLNSFELNFFAPMAKPGVRMGLKAYNKLDTFLDHFKIRKHVGKKITGFSKGEIHFEGDKNLKSDLTIFIAGGAGQALFEDSGLPLNEAGFIKTLPTCQVEGYPDVFAIGDAAHILGPAWAAKQGHIAEIMADVASYNVHHQIIGSGKSKSYVDKVSIICVMDTGNGAAYVSRTTKKETMFMLPIVGHWLKKAWGMYFINSKLKRIPRIPGL